MEQHLPGGRIVTECTIGTSDDTKVADMAWISRERLHPHRRACSLPIAPEICVELLSDSNRMGEMAGKVPLHFAHGAEEAWRCDEDGRIPFFRHDESGPAVSKRCPDFPVKIDWEGPGGAHFQPSATLLLQAGIRSMDSCARFGGMQAWRGSDVAETLPTSRSCHRLVRNGSLFVLGPQAASMAASTGACW